MPRLVAENKRIRMPVRNIGRLGYIQRDMITNIPSRLAGGAKRSTKEQTTSNCPNGDP